MKFLRHLLAAFLLMPVTGVAATVGASAAPPVPARAHDILQGKFNQQRISFEGTLLDVFPDEIDPNFLFLTIQAGNEIIYAALREKLNDENALSALISARLRIVGTCYLSNLGNRKQLGCLVDISRGGGIDVLEPPASDLFDAPDAETLVGRASSDLPALVRHTAEGKVVAVWNENFLIRTAKGNVLRIQAANGDLPGYDMFVKVVGFPESDLFNINLRRARWRVCDMDRKTVPDEAESIPVERLRSRAPDRSRIVMEAKYHGHAVRIAGRVISIPREPNPDRRIYVEGDDTVFTVDITANPDVVNAIETGARVSIDGTCVMEIDPWQPNAVFPQIRGFIVVVRTPADVRVLARPSWWTPARLATVLFCLLVLLVGSGVGNLVLRKLVDRRSWELESEIVARVGSEFKVQERTRLAVELHDAISQNLTGVALEIRTAANYAGELPAEAKRHLDIAANTLGTCRNELRNCLWDLRNDALELADMNEAIRQTLEPHLGAAALSVRFAVPRDLLSDNTAHDILHVIRELASNAVRHGKATHIRVAGAIEGDTFLCSVCDNGIGFDPKRCPGLEQGHFGLLGIRERIKAHEGEFSIESEPGTGTRATITLTVPREEQA